MEDCKISHGDKYNYNNINYKGSSKKITITCPIHGDFEQKAYSHSKGKGCPKCAKTRLKTKELFIEQAERVHKELYDYSKVEYINTMTKVIIICSEHGEFLQTPNEHLQGSGCPKCNFSKGELLIFN